MTTEAEVKITAQEVIDICSRYVNTNSREYINECQELAQYHCVSSSFKGTHMVYNFPGGSTLNVTGNKVSTKPLFI